MRLYRRVWFYITSLLSGRIDALIDGIGFDGENKSSRRFHKVFQRWCWMKAAFLIWQVTKSIPPDCGRDNDSFSMRSISVVRRARLLVSSRRFCPSFVLLSCGTSGRRWHGGRRFWRDFAKDQMFFYKTHQTRRGPKAWDRIWKSGIWNLSFNMPIKESLTGLKNVNKETNHEMVLYLRFRSCGTNKGNVLIQKDHFFAFIVHTSSQKTERNCTFILVFQPFNIYKLIIYFYHLFV